MHHVRRFTTTSLAALALAAPAAAGAQENGNGGASPTPAAPVVSVPVSTANQLLPAPVDLGGRIGAIAGMQVTLAGSLPAAAGREIVVQRQDRRGWVPIASAVAGPDGAFSAVWKVDRIGLFPIRAVPAAPVAAQAASAPQVALTPVTGYRAAKATYFGPGLFGRRTACGQRLTRRLRGIAHRTLPCGSVVELVFRGKIVRAPVVDRGPFHRGIRYDLTYATARELRFRQTDMVGAAQIAGPPQSRSR
jgi:hypothetical protein